LEKRLEKKEAEQGPKPISIASNVQERFFFVEPNWDGCRVDIGDYHSAALALNGDYYELRRISDVLIMAIICDVAGKGPPAALLVPIVATIFSSFCNSFKRKLKPEGIAQLAYEINNAIIQRELPGRFASFTIALINVQTGDSYFLGAGDSLLHVFRAEQRKMVSYVLPKSPAAGIFPSEQVSSLNAYRLVSSRLNESEAKGSGFAESMK
jgi:serine phosphatase RsbU (regulator of sigma subunit)